MDAAEAVEQVRFHHGVDLVLGGRLAGGEVGAYSAWLNGPTPVVLKWSDRPERADEWGGVVRRVKRLRAVGYPAPEYREPLKVPGGVVVLQETMPGTLSDDLGQDLVEQVLALNQLQEGLGSSGRWPELMRRSLTEGCDGWCLHEPLRIYSKEASRLLNRIEAVGRDVPALPSGDIVHLDFHHRNILRLRDTVSAVVDWEGCTDGDRQFDLVTFGFGLIDATVPASVEARFWEHLRTMIPHDHLAVYVAHMALRLADWKIRHHPSWMADAAIRIGQERLGEVT